MTNPTQRPSDRHETITECRATIITIDVGDNRTLPPRLANRPRKRYPPAPPPTGPVRPEDLVGIFVSVECTGNVTTRPHRKRAASTPEGDLGPGEQERPTA
jgi:hypothetical protein